MYGKLKIWNWNEMKNESLEVSIRDQFIAKIEEAILFLSQHHKNEVEIRLIIDDALLNAEYAIWRSKKTT